MPIKLDLHDNTSQIKISPSDGTSQVNLSHSDNIIYILLTKEVKDRIAGDAYLQEEIDNIIETGAGTIAIIENGDGSIDVSLLNTDGAVLSTATIHLTEKIIKSGVVDYNNSKVIFTCNDSSTIEVDISDIVNAIVAENNRAFAAEAVLGQRIDAEVQYRIQADNYLDSKIDGETTRATGVENQLRDDLTTETNARTAADTQLQANIDDEEHERTIADAALSTRISNEVGERASGDEALNQRIDALDMGTVGAAGSYVKTIAQSDGQVSATAQPFDTSITFEATDFNAPTTKAVRDYVNTSGGKIDTISINGVNQPVVNKNVDLPAYPTRVSLGINNVDNTADLDKPVSTATQTELDKKQNVIDSEHKLGSDLVDDSGFNHKFATQAQLDQISTNASNIQSLNSTVSGHITNTSNPHSVTKAQVGLSNVDNTTDLEKPISHAQQAALDAKQDLIDSEHMLDSDLVDDSASDNKFVTASDLVDIAANTSARHTHVNFALLETYAQTEANLADAVSKKHSHDNKAVLDATEAAYTIYDSNKLAGIEPLAQVNILEGVQRNGTDLTPDSNKKVNIIVPTQTSQLTNNGDGTSSFATVNYVDTEIATKQSTIDPSHPLDADLVDDRTSFHKFVDDTGLANIAANTEARHTHSNYNLLETYTQTENSLADAVAKKHEHDNKALLDTYTQTEGDLADAVAKKHSHDNKAVLDATTASYTTQSATKLAGIETGAEVNTIVVVQKNGTDLTPDANRKVNVVVPVNTSDLNNDGDGTSSFATVDYVDTKQDAIDSSHKLDADLVDDTTSTHKFVTASEKAQITTNQNDIADLDSTLDSHIANVSNPHSVTKAQVGLGDVVNTGDSATPAQNGTTKFTTGGAYTMQTTLQGNINTVDNKLNYNVHIESGDEMSYNGDTVTKTSGYRNLKTGATGTRSEVIHLANSTTAGMMSPTDYNQIRTNTSRIANLEGQTKRLLYSDKTNPTQQEIQDFVDDYLASIGIPNPQPEDYAGIAVVVAGTYHIWHYYSDAGVGWKDDGADTVSQFTNAISGTILGKVADGFVYAENDGTGSVYGWSALKTRVGNLETADQSIQQDILDLQNNKVDKVTGKDLSTNDFTNAYKEAVDLNTAARHSHANKALLDTYNQINADLADAVTKKHSHSNKSILDATTASFTTAKDTKLTGIETGAQVNVIETVKVNGTALTPTSKAVNISVPTKTSDLTNDGPDGTSTYATEDYVDNSVAGKQSTIDSTHPLDADLVDDTTSAHKFVTATDKTNITANTNARHTHSNKSLLDSYDQTNANLADAVSKKHSHSNKALLDSYDQTNANISDAVSKRHSHSNKTILDNTTASFTTAFSTKLTGIETGAQVNILEGVQRNGTDLTPDSNKKVNIIVPTATSDLTNDGDGTSNFATVSYVNDEIAAKQAVIDAEHPLDADLVNDASSAHKFVSAAEKSAIAANTTARHTHTNFNLLETYTQTNADIADAVSKKHSHSNKSLLDTYDQTNANIKDAVTKKHSHSNKTVLDNTTASYTTQASTKLGGIEENAQVNIIEGVKVNGTALTPDSSKAVDITVPTKTSDITNDGEGGLSKFATEGYVDTAVNNKQPTIDSAHPLNADYVDDSTSDHKFVSAADLANIASNTAARHTHSNYALLESYTQTNAALVDAVTKAHTHSNKSILDDTSAAFTTTKDTKLSGIEAGAEVNDIVSISINNSALTPDANRNVNIDLSVYALEGDLSAVALSGSYADLSGTPTIPTKNSWNYADRYVRYDDTQSLNDTQKAKARSNIGAGTSDFSGDYNDLVHKPTIPVVNNGTLTIQKNGSTVATFTANQSTNVTANITVPTVTDFYWADVKVASSSNKGTTPTFSTMTVGGSGSTAGKATMQYNANEDCIEFVFA